MYPIILSIHSLLRWFVLISLFVAIFRAYYGWMKNMPFTKLDHKIRHLTATIAHLQFMFGLGLYFVSPIIQSFLKHFQTTVHIREIRFFGMEHSLMMFTAILFITIGSMSAKRRPMDAQKFKTMALWYSVALVIILISIPWAFSTIAPHRPYFRPM